MSRRQVNAARRAFNAKKRQLGPAAWEAVKLSRKLRAKQRREEMERWLRGEVAREAASTVAPDRRQAWQERQQRLTASVAALAARVAAREEAQARRDHERTIAEADDPMVPGSAIWSSLRREPT